MPERIPADGDATVYVAASKGDLMALGLQRPHAAVVAETDNWNDYGRGYFATLHLFPTNADPMEFHLRIMFEGFQRTETAIQELVRQFGLAFPVEEIDLPFVSLIPDEEDCRLRDRCRLDLGTAEWCCTGHPQ